MTSANFTGKEILIFRSIRDDIWGTTRVLEHEIHQSLRNSVKKHLRYLVYFSSLKSVPNLIDHNYLRDFKI